MNTLECPVLLLRTNVNQKIQKKLLKRGLSSIFTGLGILWLADWLVPFAGIEDLGIYRWLASGGILSISCFPYRQVLQYKRTPEILKITENELILSRHKTEIFRIPWHLVHEIQFFETETSYGIALSLQSSKEEPCILSSLRQQSKKQYGVDLFLPFFSEHSFQLLQHWQEQKSTNPSTTYLTDKK